MATSPIPTFLEYNYIAIVQTASLWSPITFFLNFECGGEAQKLEDVIERVGTRISGWYVNMWFIISGYGESQYCLRSCASSLWLFLQPLPLLSISFPLPLSLSLPLFGSNWFPLWLSSENREKKQKAKKKIKKKKDCCCLETLNLQYTYSMALSFQAIRGFAVFTILKFIRDKLFSLYGWISQETKIRRDVVLFAWQVFHNWCEVFLKI